ncbi:MAG: VIT domain-containing protein, partial [Planctomycetaceae bacterium]
MRLAVIIAVATYCLTPHTGFAQQAQLVIPQSRGFSWDRQTQAVRVTKVDADITINEQIATTVLTVYLQNPVSRQLEAEVMIPVPNKVVVRGFDFQGNASEPTAELLPRDEARRIYNGIVAKLRDPALLEFAGFRMIRSSVFPVPANGTQTVRVTYEQLLPADGSRVDYVLPRSQSVTNKVPWTIRAVVNSKRAISTVYSPSHRVETNRTTTGQVRLRVADSASREPGNFRLSYLMDDGNVSASLLAYPDPNIKGGYFVLLAGLPAVSEKANTIKREVTIVLDRSGSMNGDKIKQAREAVRQVVAGLDDGEAFNIIVYNEAIDVFSEQPVLKSDKTEEEALEFISSIRPRGGTNIHDALLESMRQKPADGMLPSVLFLTDGLPTIGQTSEKTIRD